MKTTVDRIDGGIAVLISCDDPGVQITLPAGILPAGSREGDILGVAIEPDPYGTREARDRIAEKIRRF